MYKFLKIIMFILVILFNMVNCSMIFFNGVDNEIVNYDNRNIKKRNNSDGDVSIRSGGDDLTQENNIGTSLPYAVDYSNSQLLDYIKKGDILYDEVGSDLLVLPTGHVAIV